MEWNFYLQFWFQVKILKREKTFKLKFSKNVKNLQNLMLIYQQQKITPQIFLNGVLYI